MAVFSDMQVKQETDISDSLTTSKPHQRISSSITPSTTISSSLSPQDMQCLGSTGTTSQPQDKNSSPYSLWADYFDSFSVQTEFDLRSSNYIGSGSTGSSIASSTSSASSESWSSPGSGSPFSDCEREDSTFIDDHSVPNSVIDEIVQTLKMDGYNFDHLGDDIMDTNTSSYYPVKQEQEYITQPTCYIANPVYASLSPPKLHLHIDNTNNRKPCYNNVNIVHNTVNNNNNANMLHNSCINDTNGVSVFDQVIEGKWCTSTTTLPPMSISLQQIQQHTAQLQHQQNTVHNTQHQQHLQIHPQHIQDPQQISYATSDVQDSTMHIQYSSAPMFPGNYSALPSNNNIQAVTEQYKYLPNLPADMQQPPPLIQNCEKPTETKPRRRRSTNGPLKQEKPHVCNECGAAFKLSANLKQHQVIHTGEKPFSCDICKAMFTRLSSLKTHHRLHTGEKPHICPYCSAAFADRSAMKAHKRIHTGERPYKCVVCGTSFTQLSHLNAHKRTHTGEKPYACTICGTTFKQLGHLKRHEKSHVCSRI